MFSKILVLIAATLALAGCAQLKENINGGYHAPSGNPYYTTKNGVLYANDGARWYALRSAEVDHGDIRGLHSITPERWTVAGGSHVTYYHRTAATFRNQDLLPVFIQQ